MGCPERFHDDLATASAVEVCVWVCVYVARLRVWESNAIGKIINQTVDGPFGKEEKRFLRPNFEIDTTTINEIVWWRCGICGWFYFVWRWLVAFHHSSMVDFVFGVSRACQLMIPKLSLIDRKTWIAFSGMHFEPTGMSWRNCDSIEFGADCWMSYWMILSTGQSDTPESIHSIAPVISRERVSNDSKVAWAHSLLCLRSESADRCDVELRHIDHFRHSRCRTNQS